ncbi:DUF998 domain-containing protein [Asanoa iriomotensis]|uniref:DUF998 domain-containing protein n=1 Tax=Asanoa iriomotensis TaxID=234613 RepID=A0ABQ4C2X5_9ACTN|nr:DUF998 domain-containing protein [Asanoa iriomotensis]GIF57125.1 hypothetical protein Air01nite_32200 [Asanoa iriomotensis]
MRPPRWPAAAFGLSAVTYSSWLLAPWLNPELGLTTGLASDLAASDQPWHNLFRFGDVVAGGLVVFGSARMLLGGRRDRRRWRRLGRAERAAWLFAALFGVATICDGSLTALPCAPSIDPGCAAPLAGGVLSAVSDPHTITSGLAVIGGLGSIAAFWAASRDGSTDRTWAAGLTVGAVAINLGLLVELLRTDTGVEEAVWQRLELLNLAGWLIYAAVRSQQPPRRSA